MTKKSKTERHTITLRKDVVEKVWAFRQRVIKNDYAFVSFSTVITLILDWALSPASKLKDEDILQLYADAEIKGKWCRLPYTPFGSDWTTRKQIALRTKTL